jgi:hypothetical protein
MNTVILNISAISQPFVASNYTANMTGTFPDDVSYRVLDYLNVRSNGSPIAFDLIETGTNNVLAHCKYDPVSGVIQATLQNEFINDSQLWWYLKRSDFNSIEMTNFNYTSASSDPVPTNVLGYYVNRKIPDKVVQPFPAPVEFVDEQMSEYIEMQDMRPKSVKGRLDPIHSGFPSHLTMQKWQSAYNRVPINVRVMHDVRGSPLVEKHSWGQVVQKSTKKGFLSGKYGNVLGSVAGGAVGGAAGSIVGGIMKGIELRDKRAMADVQHKVGFQTQSNDHKQQANMKMLDYSLRRASAIGSLSSVNEKFQGKFGKQDFQAGDYTYHSNLSNFDD